MKKYILFLMSLLIFTGCTKNNTGDVKKEFIKNFEKKDVYLVKGKMDIVSNEDTFNYEVVAARYKDDYRVDLNNNINNHKQIILRNDNDVYVITPSLNKSFKFQSEWPNNGSQGYLIDSLISDIVNDSESAYVVDGENYIITTKVNYPNNNSLVNEKIYFDKDYNLKMVEVLDSDANVKIKIEFNNIDFKPTFKDDYFELESLIEDTEIEEDENVSKIIDDIIYPLYLPTNTFLNSKDIVNTDDGNRIILTFSGDSPFTLVEEKSVVNEEFEIIPVYGEPLMLSDTYGALSSNSLYWTSNNIDFYLSSDKLSTTELRTIAESISSGTLSVVGEK